MTKKQLKYSKLDSLDLQLLYYLDLNSRTSLPTLAKKMHTSSAKLRYRQEQLEKNGSIKSYITLIDYRKLRFRGYAVYYKLKEIDNKKLKKVLDVIINSPKVVDVILTQGTYDLQIVFLAKTTDDAAEALWHIRETLTEYVLDSARVIHLRSHFFPRENFLQEDKSEDVSTKLVLDVFRKEYVIDDIDKKILTVISNRANWPMWKIAEKTGVKGPTVYSRIKKLEKRGVIIGYSIKIDPNLEDYSFYRIFVKLRYMTPRRRNELMGFFKQRPEIHRATFSFGDFDLHYDIRISGTSELRVLLSEVYSNFSEEVVRQDWIRIHDILKFSYFLNE